MWGQSWEPIAGRIITSKEVRGGGSFQSRKYVVEYTVDGGPPQRVELSRVRGWGYWPRMINPHDGSNVPLLLNRRSGKVRFDVKDPAINFRARRKAAEADENAQYDRAMKG
jgi:hypothetical protein